MAKVHFVKKARKDIPIAGVKAGESYYWWQNYKRPKKYSKTPPKRSQTAGSSFYQELYSIDESIEEADIVDRDALKAILEESISSLEELRDQTQESLDNMPEGLQQGDTGQLMQERIDALDTYIDELQQIDADDDDEPLDDQIKALQMAMGGHGL